MLLELVRRPARGNEVQFIEIETPVRSARDAKMTAVNGIEGTAKKRDASWMVFYGGAVRLRGRQCASPEFSDLDFLMNSRLRQRAARKGQL